MQSNNMKVHSGGSAETLKRVETLHSVLRSIGIKDEPTEPEYTRAHQAP